MKLLFAIVFPFKVAATYLDDAGETQTKDLPVSPAALTLVKATTALVGNIKSVQIATEHAEGETGHMRLEAVTEDGVPHTVLAEDDLQAANEAVRAEVEAAL